jgi:hypothetical protein
MAKINTKRERKTRKKFSFSIKNFRINKINKYKAVSYMLFHIPFLVYEKRILFDPKTTKKVLI